MNNQETIELTSGTNSHVWYHATANLRWYKSDEGPFKLQQMWQGSDGTVKWEFVEYVDESEPKNQQQ